MAEHPPDGPDTLHIPFIFVRHGDPPPLEWMARHPGWIKIPAVMIPRNAPAHPGNGGPYPTFSAPPPPAPKPASPAEAEAWPLGRPVAAGLRGAMSRLRPGVPPRYPGGHGAPAGMFPWVDDDPVAAFLRANAVFERVQGPRPAETQASPLAGVADEGGGKVDPPDTTERIAAGAGNEGSQTPPAGGDPAGNVDLAQWAAPVPLPAPPLPPVFSPHTPENEAVVHSLIDGWHALWRAAEGGVHHDADEAPDQQKPTSVEELPDSSSPGRKTKGRSSQYDRPGSIEDADRDFDALQPTDIRTDPRKPGLRIGTLPDGRTLTVRPGSTDTRPTLEIYNPSNGRKTKLRYGEKNEQE